MMLHHLWYDWWHYTTVTGEQYEQWILLPHSHNLSSILFLSVHRYNRLHLTSTFLPLEARILFFVLYFWCIACQHAYFSKVSPAQHQCYRPKQVWYLSQEAQKSWKLWWIFKVTQHSYRNICAGKTSLNYIKLLFTVCCSEQLNSSKCAIPKGQIIKKMTKGCKTFKFKV